MYLYIRIYKKENESVIIYTGITNDMDRRQKEHNDNKSKTTTKYNKLYCLKEIRYRKIIIKEYEKTFKKYNIGRKLHLSLNWDVWTG